MCQNIKKLWYLDEFFLFTLADRDLQGWPIDIPNTGTLISKQCEINSSEIWLSELREDWTSLCAWPGVMIQSSGTSNSKSKGPRCSPVLNTCIYLQISINWKIGLVHLHSMGIRNLIPHNWNILYIVYPISTWIEFNPKLARYLKKKSDSNYFIVKCAAWKGKSQKLWKIHDQNFASTV